MNPSVPSYITDLIAAHQSGKLPRGQVGIAVVAHDDACDIFGGRCCNCDAEVRIVGIEQIAEDASA